MCVNNAKEEIMKKLIALLVILNILLYSVICWLGFKSPPREYGQQTYNFLFFSKGEVSASQDQKNWTASDFQFSVEKELSNNFIAIKADAGNVFLMINAELQSKDEDLLTVTVSNIYLVSKYEKTVKIEISAIGITGSSGFCGNYFFPRDSPVRKGFITNEYIGGGAYTYGREKEDDQYTVTALQNPMRFCLAFEVGESLDNEYFLHFGDADIALPKIEVK